MQAFNFKCPTEIVFGPKAQERIAEKIMKNDQQTSNTHSVW